MKIFWIQNFLNTKYFVTYFCLQYLWQSWANQWVLTPKQPNLVVISANVGWMPKTVYESCLELLQEAELGQVLV